eukprot:gene11363-21557_t
MKTLIIFCIVAAISAEKFQMKLEENGEKFAEEIEVDVAGNTEEIKVPKHQDRMQVDLLNDFNIGLSATKLPAIKKCYISAIGTTEQSPQGMKESLEKTHARFPTERYMVKTRSDLIVRRMTADEVGEKIVAHCGGYEMLYTVDVSQGNVEKVAISLAEEVAGKTKRSTIIKRFFACNLESTNVINTCRNKGKLGARCSFYRTDLRRCIYEIDCPANISDKGLSATCKGTHQFNLLQCCDFICFPFGK